jgi:hypothetical protein
MSEQKINIDDISKLLFSTVKEFGGFLNRLGEIEKESKISFGKFAELSKDPAFFSSLFASAPPEKVGNLIKNLFKFVELTPKINQAMGLSAEEKIELGKKLEELANTLKPLVEQK